MSPTAGDSQSAKDLRKPSVLFPVKPVCATGSVDRAWVGDWRNRAAARAAGFVAAIFLANCLSAQSISNGTFEDGLPPGTPPAQWDTTGDFYHWTNPGKAHTGSQYAYFGIASDGMTPMTNSSGSIEQPINLLANAASAVLSFWLWIASDQPASEAHDHLFVEVLSSSGSVLATLADFSNANAANPFASMTPAYVQRNYSLAQFVGPVRIRFRGTTDASAATIFRLDDVALTIDPSDYCLVRVNVPGWACVPEDCWCGPTSLPAEGGTILGTAAGLVWATAPPWVMVSPQFGPPATGTIMIVVLPNDGPPRSGTLMFTDGLQVQTVPITQAGAVQPRLVNPVHLPGGAFQFTIVGITNQACVIEASADLRNWTPVATNAPSPGPLPFTDTTAAHDPVRFYRTVISP